MNEVHEVRAEGGVLEHHVAGLPDQAVPEHQAVLLVGELGRQGPRAGDHLEGGLEQPGERVPDGAGQAAQQRHPEGHVVHDLDRRAAGLVDDAHGDLGHNQDAEDQHHGGEPLPALELFRGKRVGDERGDEAAEGHRRDG